MKCPKCGYPHAEPPKCRACGAEIKLEEESKVLEEEPKPSEEETEKAEEPEE